MRLIHMADLHLGYRQYQRQTPSGMNQREADVADVFKRAIDGIIARAPDVVVVAGDIFHAVRPPNPAIVHAFNQFARLRSELPRADIVVISGNHDTPKQNEIGSLLQLFAPLGVHVVEGAASRIPLLERDLSILAVPHTVGKRPEMRPDPAFRYNVLLLHGEVAGVLPDTITRGDRATLEVSLEELGADRWTYVALGHYHVYRAVAPNAYYSGSLDYTSLNLWGDLAEEAVARIPGKGFIEFDFGTGTHRFHTVAPSRELVDLPSFSARGLMATDVDAHIRDSIAACRGGIEGKIVRLLIRDIPRHIVRDLDHQALRDYQRRALHFQLDTRRPEVIRLIGQAAGGRRPSLADIVRDKLQGRLLEGDIDRSALVELGLHYLAEAETVSTAALVPDGVGGDA
jgi:DNA repair protein SbcD/Mre11